MKKLALLLISGLMLTSCSDLLDTDPYDQFTKDNFFTSEANVKLYANYFYNEFAGYGSGNGDFYFNYLNDDQGTTGTTQWTYTNVPATAGAWSTPYTEIRRANILIEALPGISSMSESAKANWEGIARLYRGWQHFKLVRNYGDCYWVDKVLDVNDADVLYGERQSRNFVMDNVLADLNYACEHITADADSRVAFNKYVALAIKSRVCLFEGTYSKYVMNDKARSDKYLTEAKNASLEIMNSKKFALNGDFKSNFDQLNLAGNPEMIMYKHYELGVLAHGTVDYTCGSTQVHGITKDAFDSYLFKDGKPKASTTCNKSEDGKIVEFDDMSGYGVQKFIDISDVLAQRDPRLAAQVDYILQFPGCGYSRYGVIADPQFTGAQRQAAQSTSATGYGVLLFDTGVMKSSDRQSTNTNTTDAPIFWYAEVLLNYAEACAELGTITDSDLDKSINLLRDRVKMPHLATSVAADPANNMNVSNIIWEVRRERRVEMMYCLNDRYYSLQRWNKLSLLDTQKYPNQCRGAYVGNLKGTEGIDWSQVKVDEDGYINCKGTGAERIYDAKYLLLPIPNGQKTLNPAIGQNPGW
ncbi:MAG: RagB/SusD family nutrient uptake outer membrane protein [Bacteroidales bacterium]|nr:RagB/SusD family nutrient uptake outer membrane protein [Candidatus Sodaliphilus aphodohippi]